MKWYFAYGSNMNAAEAPADRMTAKKAFIPNPAVLFPLLPLGLFLR